MILHGKDLIVSIDGNAAFASKSCSLEVNAKSIAKTSPTSGEWEENASGMKSWRLSTNQLVKKAESGDIPAVIDYETTFAVTNSVTDGWNARGEQVFGIEGTAYVFDEVGMTEGIDVLRVNSMNCQLLDKQHFNSDATGLLTYLNSDTIGNDDLLFIMTNGDFVLPANVVSKLSTVYHTALPFIEFGNTSLWGNEYTTIPLIIVCGKGLAQGYSALNSTNNSLNFSLVNGTNFVLDGIPGAIEMVGKMVSLRMTDNNGSIWAGQAEIVTFKVTGSKGNLMAGSFSFRGNGEIQSNKKIDMPNFYTPGKYVDRIIIDMSQSNSVQMITGDINGDIFRYRTSFNRRVLGKYMGNGVMAICPLDNNNSTIYAEGGTVATLDGTQGDVFSMFGGIWYEIKQIDTNRVMFSVAEQSMGDDWKFWSNNNLIGAFKAQATTDYNNNTIAGNGEDYYLRSILSNVGARTDSYTNFTTQMQMINSSTQMPKMNPSYFCKIGPEEHAIIALLAMMKYGTTDLKGVCGRGVTYGLYTGATSLLGIKDTTPLNDVQGINLFGLENWWNGTNEWMDRIEVSGDAWTITHLDGTTTTTHASVDGSQSVINKLAFGAEKLYMTPSGVMSIKDFSKYFCDALQPWPSTVENYKVARAGNGRFEKALGPFTMKSIIGSVDEYTTRLCFHGVNVIEYYPTEFEALTPADPSL